VSAVFIQPPITYILQAGQTPSLDWHVPNATFKNSQVGVRLHTLIAGNTEATVFYWRSFEQTPQLQFDSLPDRNKIRHIHEIYPNFQGIGATANRPLYELPTWLVNKLPIVLRAEMFYKNHVTFVSKDRSEATGDSNSDQLLTMFALDVDSAPAPWLTTTGTLSTNLEWVNTLTTNSNANMLFAQGQLESVHHNNTNLFFDIATSWWWNAVAPTWAMIYNPTGNTFLLVPSITLTPPWTNKYFMKMGTVYILGSDANAFDAGGSIKGLSSVFAEFQYNFKLL
jgi:hypothetical protein